MNLTAAQAYKQKHDNQLDQVGKILGTSDRITKWRMAVAYYLQEHPEARQIYRSLAKECEQKRQEYAISNVGTRRTAKKTEFQEHMHSRVDLPSFVHYTLCTFDPEFASVMTGGETNFAQAKWSRLLRKAFPEFVVHEG